jgi:hypothetical protein
VGSIIQHAWKRWRIVGNINGDYIARFVAFAFYYTLMVPFALITRIFVDPLGTRKSAAPGYTPTWRARKPVGSTLEEARGQS